MDVLVRRRLALAVGLYFLLATAAFPFFRYQIGPDALHYISLAQLYRGGWWSEAVNAYASPLVSWLLAATLSLPLDPVAVFKLQNLGVGAFGLPAVAALCRCFRLAPANESLALFCAPPFLVFAALIATTPDLLLTVVLSFYLAYVLSPGSGDRRSDGWRAGVFAALSYFAKAYAFPFLVLHFPLVTFLRWKAAPREARPKVLRDAGIAVLTFSTIAGIWIAVLYAKYDRLMYASTGAFNHALFGPRSREPGWFPSDRLLPPPHPGIVIDHPDPTVKILEAGHGLVSWNPFGSEAEWQRQKALLSETLPSTAGILVRFSPFAPFVIAGLAVAAWRRRTSSDGFVPAAALVTIAVYPAGYLLLTVEQRFLWAIWPLLLASTFWALEHLWRLRAWTLTARTAAAGLVALSFVAMPARWLVINAGSDDWRPALAATLRDRFGVGGRIASDGDFAETAYLALFLGASYYGTVGADDPSHVQRELARHHVDFYLTRGRPLPEPSAIGADAEVTGGSVPGIRAYRLKPPS